MEELKLRFGIKCEKLIESTWSIGITMAHWDEQVYIDVHLFKWTVAIGRLYLTT